MSLLILVLALLVLRRRRTTSAFISPRLLGIVGTLGLCALMLAAPNSNIEARESPRVGTANFRFGTYLPEIDSEFSDGTAHPYADVFGSDKMWLFRAESGYLLFDRFGSVFLTVELGYGRATGAGIETATGTESNDDTTMHFLPMSVNLIYQFDLLARHMGFPLVPYARTGYDYWVWWITDGLGDVADRSSIADNQPCEAEPCAPAPEFEVISDGMGGTQGYHLGGGMRLLLDGFGQKMAKDFDNEMGFNDSYLFAEVTLLDLDDFGSGSSFILSDTMFSFGLGFDF